MLEIIYISQINISHSVHSAEMASVGVIPPNYCASHLSVLDETHFGRKIQNFNPGTYKFINQYIEIKQQYR